MDIGELKSVLQKFIDALEMSFDDDTPVKLAPNTRNIQGRFYLGTPEGFVDFRKPVDEDMEECFLGLNESEEGEEDLDEYGRKWQDVAEEGLIQEKDEGGESVEDWINKGHFALADNDEDGIRAALEWLETHEDIMNPEEQEQYETLKDIAEDLASDGQLRETRKSGYMKDKPGYSWTIYFDDDDSTDTNSWKYVQNIIRKKGKDSIIRDFGTFSYSPGYHKAVKIVDNATGEVIYPRSKEFLAKLLTVTPNKEGLIEYPEED